MTTKDKTQTHDIEFLGVKYKKTKADNYGGLDYYNIYVNKDLSVATWCLKGNWAAQIETNNYSTMELWAEEEELLPTEIKALKALANTILKMLKTIGATPTSTSVKILKRNE